MAMNGGFFRGFYQLKPESGRAKRVGSHSRPPVFSIERAGARGRSAERHVFIPVPCGCMQMTFWTPNKPCRWGVFCARDEAAKTFHSGILDFSYLPYFYHCGTATR